MEKSTKQFTHRNESFICSNCGEHVLPAAKSCRNHCPVCLYSLHLDIFPGDRRADCKGTMRPISVEYHTKKGYQIIHQCISCGHESRNILNLDDPIQPDSMESVLKIMKSKQ